MASSDPIEPERSGHRKLVRLAGAGLVVGGAVALLATLFVSLAPFAPALSLLAASLFLAGIGFLTEAMVLGVRESGGHEIAPLWRPLNRGEVETALERWAIAQSERLWRQLASEDWIGGWWPIIGSLVGGAIALTVIARTWSGIATTYSDAFPLQLFGGALIVLAFPLLLLDRTFAAFDEAKLPAAQRLERLLRLPLAACIGLGLASILRALGMEWPLLIERAVAIVIGLVALEIGVRNLVRLALPLPPLEERAPAASSLAGLISLSRPNIGEFNVAVQSQFGIDLSRSWAMAFIARAAAPVLVGMIVFAWALTGVTALGIDQRAVYEQLGQPVSVMGPGLHVHLPWPLGIMRSVELGVVHEIPIVFPSEGESTSAEAVPETKVGAEAEPPPSADRLWDSTHPSEASYLIASMSGTERQSFQIVNIDLRIVYRTGLSDEAAKAAAYRIADAQALIRAASGRMLVRHFSHVTLLDVLGENRARFVTAFRSELQQHLDKLGTGVEIVAVIVEAIHPPPGAAGSYQNVQAAEINATAQISQSKANATRTLKSAEQSATDARNTATASAAEQTDRAEADNTLFSGDRDAYSHGGHAFLLERWLGDLSKALKAAPLVVIDHRLGGASAPTIDLRRFDSKSGNAQIVVPDE